MRKLIPMTDYVLEQDEIKNVYDSMKFYNCLNYANFLKQPLEIKIILEIFDGFNLENAQMVMLSGSLRTVEDLIQYNLTLTQETYERYF